MPGNKILVADPKKMEWESLEQSSKGTLAKILMHNKETGALALIAKIEKNMKAPKHKHSSDCHVLVLKGKQVRSKRVITVSSLQM